MTLLTVGFNHQSAPLSIREKIAFPTGEAVRAALNGLRSKLPGTQAEAAILSTCNRTEIYCQSDAGHEAGQALAEWFDAHGRHFGLPDREVSGHLYTLPGPAAVQHAFRVASGLDSMVLGEPQILGQMKEAARLAQCSQTLGSHLHQLFQRSFAVAKQVRTRTAIGSSSVSMAAASVRLGQRIFEHIEDCRLLLIGAGEMIELCAAHWARHCRSLTIANRTAERASVLAGRYGANAIALGGIAETLGDYDVVLSCTASSLPIIGLGMVERAVRRRRHQPMLMIDLAVPRDIEPDVERVPDVYLYTVDDLSEVVEAGIEQRRAAVAEAEGIIATEVESFMRWMHQRHAAPLVRELQSRGDAVRQAEFEHAKRMLARGDDPEQVLEALSVALTNKFLHGSRQILQRHEAWFEARPDRALRGAQAAADQWLRELIPDPRR